MSRRDLVMILTAAGLSRVPALRLGWTNGPRPLSEPARIWRGQDIAERLSVLTQNLIDSGDVACHAMILIHGCERRLSYAERWPRRPTDAQADAFRRRAGQAIADYLNEYELPQEVRA